MQNPSAVLADQRCGAGAWAGAGGAVIVTSMLRPPLSRPPSRIAGCVAAI
jgi:hypothetical protein